MTKQVHIVSPRKQQRTDGRGARRTASGSHTTSCKCGKFRFRDHALAIQALHSAQRSRKIARELGTTTRRQERRAYPCDLCNGWHLTSRETPTASRNH